MIEMHQAKDVATVTFSNADVKQSFRASVYADFNDVNDLTGVEILQFRKQLPGVIAPSVRERTMAASFDPEVDAWSVGRIGGGVARTEPRTAEIEVDAEGSIIAIRVQLRNE